MLVRSTALSEAAYSALEKATQGNLRLTAFLDTNFLFSLIGLHDNPADDVVAALKQILPRVKGHVDVRLYVLPITVDEARETIARYRDKLAGITLGRSLASAARTRLSEMSGITLKYVQEATRGDRTLSATEYFRPYIDDLISICRSRGVEFYNTDLSELRTDQKVIDDLNDQIKFQERRRENGAKPYPVILHDMVLWHFANRRRAVRVESPLEAEYWVATIDFGLLGFDAHKNRGRGKGVPLCIHPTVLLQMLQFWIPQSEELERALIDSLRPMLPHEYDRESEETTISMLQAVSRFEGIDDLGEEVLGRVLINDALRTRVRATPEVAEQVELVREAIVNEAASAKQEAEAAKEEMAQLLRTVSDKEAELDGMREELDTVRAGAADENRRLSEALLESRSAQERLEKRLDRVEDERRKESAARKATLHNGFMLLGIIAITAVSATAGLIFLPDVLLDWLDLAPLVAAAAAPLISVGGALSLIDLSAPWFFQRREYVVLEKLHQTRRWLWGLVGLVMVGLLVNYLSDALDRG